MEQAPNTPQIGSVVTITELTNEKFVIGKILRGGMGSVYQLIPVAPLGTALALKTYQQSASREQFIREADLWISLGNHAHIARALVYLEWQSQPSIIAEWYKQTVESHTVESWPTAKLINFTTGLVDGLEYAHRVCGIIHQDIKPANILLDRNDEPRLTDFGMARFANRTDGIGSLEDINSSMVHSATLGPIGGTPMYMAPELFAGQPPSVRTDIFSLGVTLYQIATGEHPYCGSETNHRLRPILRTRPLDLFLKKRGNDASRLVSVITAAVQLDPLKRPGSYRALHQLIGQKSPQVRDGRGDSTRDVIVRAGFLRDTGRTQEAMELLQAAIAERPANPELLNSLAVLLLKLGQNQRAYAIWGSAVDCLKVTDGRHNHTLYLDPLVNLAWRLVPEGQFTRADDLFTQMAEWCTGSPLAPYDYMEFGWWHLYHGRFEEAWQHIAACGKSKVPDERSLWCFTLAAWLSGKFSERAETIAQTYLNPRVQIGYVTALLACMIAPFVAAGRRREIRALCFPRFANELAEVSQQMGLQLPDLLLSLPIGEIRKVIQSFDELVTGGKHRGRI